MSAQDPRPTRIAVRIMPPLHGKSTLARKWPQLWVDCDEIYRKYLDRPLHLQAKQLGLSTGDWTLLQRMEKTAIATAYREGEQRGLLVHGLRAAEGITHAGYDLLVYWVAPLPLLEFTRRAINRAVRMFWRGRSIARVSEMILLCCHAYYDYRRAARGGDL